MSGISASDPICYSRSGLSGRSRDCFANSPLNTTATKVVLLILGSICVAFGTYGALVAPKIWGSYVALGAGAASYLLMITMIFSKKITNVDITESVPHSLVPSQARSTSTLKQGAIISHSQPRPLIDFHISQLFNYEKFRDLAEFDGKNVRLTALTEQCPQSVFDLFEGKNEPIIRGKDRLGNQCVFVRYSIYNTAGEWVEDSVIQFFHHGGKWRAYAYPLARQDFVFTLESQCRADSKQTQWLQCLVKGESLPLTSFFFDATPSAAYVCKLWDPTTQVKTRIERIFRKKDYPNIDFPKADSTNLFFYNSLKAVVADYRKVPIIQGQMRHGEPFYLVNFKCALQAYPHRIIDFGYLFIWQDIHCGKKWRVHMNSAFIGKYGLQVLSSEQLSNLQENEINDLNALVGGEGWIKEGLVAELPLLASVIIDPILIRVVTVNLTDSI